jgi:hypothetical protein
MEQFDNILDFIGFTVIAAAVVYLGAGWWWQADSMSEGHTVTGGKARVLSVALIVGGLALGLFGWLTIAGIIVPSAPGTDGPVARAPKSPKPGTLNRGPRRASLRNPKVEAGELGAEPPDNLGPEGQILDSAPTEGAQTVSPPIEAPGLEGESRPQAPR